MNNLSRTNNNRVVRDSNPQVYKKGIQLYQFAKISPKIEQFIYVYWESFVIQQIPWCATPVLKEGLVKFFPNQKVAGE